MEENNAQRKMTDIIREKVMDFVWEDDSVESFRQLGEIDRQLIAIDIRFDDLDKECRSLRSRAVKAEMKLQKYKKLYGELED